MTATRFSPLHVEAPRLVADASLSEHLAALARASTPSAASRVRRSGWKVPVAAVATIAASGGVAYAGQAALHGRIAPKPLTVPTNAARPHVAGGTPRATAPATPAVTPSHKPANPHGKVVGRGHPKTRGHSGKQDHAGVHDRPDTSGAPSKERDTSVERATTVSTFDIPQWRKTVGSAGASAP